MNNIGKHIRQIRIRQGMTQDQLAEALFVTRQSISNYETGKSKPDIDMLLRIADTLHTDMDSLLYGPPPEVAQNKQRKRAIISGLFFCVLLVAYQLLLLVFSNAWKNLFMAPVLLLRLTLRPAMYFALGWFVLHCVGMLWKRKSLPTKTFQIIRRILVSIGIVIVLFLLPTVVYLLIAIYQHISTNSVNLVVPPIPIYTQTVNAFLRITAKCSYLYAFLGAAYRFFDLPRQK